MLKGKTALITGASRGIGRGIAKKFAENGAFVGINYHSYEKGAKETQKLIKDNCGDGILLKGDVSNPKEVENIVNTFIEKTGQIDILVNNAGVYNRKYFDELTIDTWNNILSINLTGCFNLCKLTIPHMKKGSKIIFISSQLALKGSTHGADYATSKAGILGLARSLALELSDRNINVNSVAPGTINTDIIANYTEEMKKERIKDIPLKRLGTAEDVANTCLFLASDLSDYITGETINVNGGLYIH
jgi:3-oxoacyl-[acyl-carrier protein] reductase